MKPLEAKLISIKLTPKELQQLIKKGRTEVKPTNEEKLELPQGPAFINGTWLV